VTQIWLILVAAAHIAAAWQPFDAQFVRSGMGREVTICLDGQKVERTFAGKMGFRDVSGTWWSVCADVRSPVSHGHISTMQPANSLKLGGNIAKAGSIVARCFKDAQTADQCAGLQVAVWKAIEDGPDVPDFNSGRFQVRASSAIIGYAQQYYLSGMSPPQSGTSSPQSGGATTATSMLAPAIFLATQSGQSQMAPPP